MIYFAAGWVTVREIVNLDPEEFPFGVLSTYLEFANSSLPKLNRPLVLDSGAFSIATGKSDHTIQDYMKFLESNADRCFWYAGLDVIGDAKKTRDNQLLMEKNGFNPMPTFHMGSDYKYLEEMIEKYEYIGLGGLVPFLKGRDGNKAAMLSHLDKCFSLIRDKVKVHCWGCTTLELCLKYPFYSVDSTSWLSGGRHGRRIIRKSNGFYGSHANVFTRQLGRSAYKYINTQNVQTLSKSFIDISEIWKRRKIQVASHLRTTE